MNWKDLADFITTVGVPGFIAIFVIVRLQPEIRRLRDSITSLTVVTAKSNGMKGKDVAEIIKLVADRGHNRRIEDKVDADVDKPEK